MRTIHFPTRGLYRPLFLVLATAAFLLASSATALAIPHPYQVNLVRPPPVLLTGVRNVAIGTFDGEWGIELASTLRSSLLTEYRGNYDRRFPVLEPANDIRVFTLLERSQLDAIYAEGGSTEAAGAVILGQVHVINWQDEWTKERREVREKRGEDWVTVIRDFQCLERRVQLAADIRVVDAIDAHIVAEMNREAGAGGKECNQDPNQVNLPSFPVLVRQVTEQLGSWIAGQISPRWDTENIFMVKDRTVRTVVRDISRGDITPAQGIAAFEGILLEDPYNHLAIHNIGVISEWYGDYTGARQRYLEAQRIRAEAPYARSLERLDRRVAEAGQLQLIGLDPQGAAPMAPVAIAPSQAPERGVVKGGRSRRVPLYAGTEDGVEILAQLPGRMQVIIISRKDAWVQIETPDGLRGWLPRRQVR